MTMVNAIGQAGKAGGDLVLGVSRGEFADRPHGGSAR